jgi:hypothetical protein
MVREPADPDEPAPDPPLTLAQLQEALELHRRELARLLKMNEHQFRAFRRNFSFGCLLQLTRIEAESMVRSMIAVNLKLQQEHPDHPQGRRLTLSVVDNPDTTPERPSPDPPGHTPV